MTRFSTAIANHILFLALKSTVVGLSTLVTCWCMTPTISSNMPHSSTPKASQLSYTLSRSTSSFPLSLVTRSSIRHSMILTFVPLITNISIVVNPCLAILIKDLTLVHQDFKNPNLVESDKLFNLQTKTTLKLDTLRRFRPTSL